MGEDGLEAACPTCGSPIESGGTGCPNCGRLIGSTQPSQPKTVFAAILGIPAGLIVNVMLGFMAFTFVSAGPPSVLRALLVIGLEVAFFGTLYFLGVRLVRRGQPALGYFLMVLTGSAALPTTACDVFYFVGLAGHR
jgi:hypothetical protein